MPNNAELSEPMLEAMRVVAQQSGKDLNSLLNEAWNSTSLVGNLITKSMNRLPTVRPMLDG